MHLTKVIYVLFLDLLIRVSKNSASLNGTSARLP